MRVLESKPVVTQTMGKKKHKLRKQIKENKLCPGSDTSDEAGALGAIGGQVCGHVNKSINLGAVKKAIKQQGTIGECTSCTRDTSAGKKSEKQEGTPSPVSVVEDEAIESIEPTMWICLQCGHQGCDRNSREKHALKHFQTPRSSSHAVVVNITTWFIWCYACDEEVACDASKKLTESVEFLRKQCGVSTRSDSTGRVVARVEQSAQDSTEIPMTTSKDEVSKQSKKQQQSSADITLPKVRGLSNLGNTCFFNAVMQNLSQTPSLDYVLLERAKKNLTVNIPATVIESSDSESDSEYIEDPDEKMHLEALDISLPECGPLTISLLNFLSDMNNPAKNGILSPTRLFGQICKKAPRFKGFQQQDSHELLRHLLDGMKAEEVKRSQRGILKVYGLSENPNPKKLEDDTKRKVKEYGRLVKHTFVDSIFQGIFISTVLCEECKYPSQIFEPFLDISLPITEEKPLRPNNIWSSRKKQDLTKETASSLQSAESATSNLNEKPSKHSLKKAKRAARKEAKKKKVPTATLR